MTNKTQQTWWWWHRLWFNYLSSPAMTAFCPAESETPHVPLYASCEEQSETVTFMWIYFMLMISFIFIKLIFYGRVKAQDHLQFEIKGSSISWRYTNRMSTFAIQLPASRALEIKLETSKRAHVILLRLLLETNEKNSLNQDYEATDSLWQWITLSTDHM